MPTVIHVPGHGTVEFPDSMSEADIQQAVGEIVGVVEKQNTPLQGWMPTLGALGGSAVGAYFGGPVGRIGGAIGGGALGKGGELLLNDRDDSAGDAAMSMAVEGGLQGAADVVGGVVGKGMKALAPRLATIALNPIESVARKYPKLGETFVREGKLIMPGMRGGVGAVGKPSSAEQAKALMRSSKAAGDAAIDAADASGAAQVSGRRVVGELRPLYDKAAIAAKTGKADARPEILTRARSFARQNRNIPNAHANVLRRSLDDSAEKAFEAERRMGTAAPLEAQMDKALAGGLRSQVRQNVPGSQAIAGRTQELAGLGKALDKASTRKHLLTRNLALTAGATGLGSGVLSGDPGAGLGAGVGTLGATYMLTNPRMLGRLALMAGRTGKLAEHAPNAARLTALLAALAQEDEGQ